MLLAGQLATCPGLREVHRCAAKLLCPERYHSPPVDGQAYWSAHVHGAVWPFWGCHSADSFVSTLFDQVTVDFILIVICRAAYSTILELSIALEPSNLLIASFFPRDSFLNCYLIMQPAAEAHIGSAHHATVANEIVRGQEEDEEEEADSDLDDGEGMLYELQEAIGASGGGFFFRWTRFPLKLWIHFRPSVVMGPARFDKEAGDVVQWAQ